MSPSEEGSRPKSATGGVDWEKIFEDPDHGIIGLIIRADSEENLRILVNAVIKKLHTRDGDED